MIPVLAGVLLIINFLVNTAFITYIFVKQIRYIFSEAEKRKKLLNNT